MVCRRTRLSSPTLGALVSVACLAAMTLAPSQASACGGCFNTVPPAAPGQPANGLSVLQDAERVVFTRDTVKGLTRVWVEVRYTGAAADFGWVLPVPKVPTISVGTSVGLDLIDDLTGARFQVKSVSAENCRNPSDGCEVFGMDAGSSSSPDAVPTDAMSAGGNPDPAPTVDVLDQGQSGPYDYTVLKSNSAAALQAWLDTRGYKTPASAKPIIQAHITKGDVFVAIKLTNGNGVNLIRPIVLEMKDAEPCVPLRLTSIAATEEMSVVVTLAGPGRAVPKNMLHVRINDAMINWFDGGKNYQQVLSAAIDEASGRGFVTEYAQQGAAFKTAAWSPKKLDTSGLAGAVNLVDVAVWLHGTGTTWLHKDAAQVFVEKAGIIEPIYKTWGIQDPAKALGQLWVCGAIWSGNAVGATDSGGAADAGGPGTGCVRAGTDVIGAKQVLFGAAAKLVTIDGKALAAALDKDIGAPLTQLLTDLGGADRVTRLAMRIGPAEMDRDPIFDFNPGLPDVERTTTATRAAVCSNGWAPNDGFRLTIPNVGSYVFPVSLASNATDPRFKGAPFARVIEVLDDAGAPIAVGPSQVDLVDTALAGAVIGKVSPAKALALTAPAAWHGPASDPPVVMLGGWKKPAGCVAKAGWVDGQLPPGSPAVDAGATSDVSGADAGSDAGVLGDASLSDASLSDSTVAGSDTGAAPPRTTSDGGCAAGPRRVPGLPWFWLVAVAAVAVLWRRVRRA